MCSRYLSILPSSPLWFHEGSFFCLPLLTASAMLETRWYVLSHPVYLVSVLPCLLFLDP